MVLFVGVCETSVVLDTSVITRYGFREVNTGTYIVVNKQIEFVQRAVEEFIEKVCEYNCYCTYAILYTLLCIGVDVRRVVTELVREALRVYRPRDKVDVVNVSEDNGSATIDTIRVTARGYLGSTVVCIVLELPTSVVEFEEAKAVGKLMEYLTRHLFCVERDELHRVCIPWLQE